MSEKKRGNGEGSKPRKRADGRWEARYHDANGKRRTLYGKTRREVAGKLSEALSRDDEPTTTQTQDATLAAFLEEYEGVARDTMKRRSFETMQSVNRVHLLPTLGSTNLRDLDREQVQRMYSRKRNDGYSAARIRRIHAVLSAALNVAVRWRLIERNVCKEVSPPRVPPPEIRPLSLDEAKRLLEAVRDDRYEALFVLGLTSGARWGELNGLYWSDLDLDRKAMRIQRSLIKGRGGYTFDAPKTSTSRRSVALTRRAVEALDRHKGRQQSEGRKVSGNELVFTNTVGNPVNHSHFMRKHFKKALERADLPDTTWHAATRHTCTCILLLEGVNPKSVSMQMGWSSVAFMLQNYSQFLPGWGDNGAMDAALG